MKTRIVALIGLMLISTGAFANHDNLSLNAALGGAIGGAVGGFLGAGMGGRDGAIIGSGIGAVAGTAYSTRNHYYYAPPRRSVHVYHYYTPAPRVHYHRHRHYPRHYYRGRVTPCPPGLRMQGRCY